MRTRDGTILIIMAGLCALLASLGLAFVMRMRGDVDNGLVVLRHAQARVMLVAACQYVMEASRLGVRNASGGYGEGFGWVDVRDGYMGPRGADDPIGNLHGIASAADREALRAAATTAARNALIGDGMTPGRRPSPNFPIGTVGRFPMYAWTRPPSAVSPRQPNPIETREARPEFGMPLQRSMDPVAWGRQPGETPTLSFSEWRTGDPAPLPGTQNLAWFRVYRDGPATFTLTCGAGGSAGFKDWPEVDAGSRSALFGDDESRFLDTVASEVRLWYRIEWSAAVAAGTRNTYEDDYFRHNQTVQVNTVSSGGSILWIQRLLAPPTRW